ncbi:hypothetical protein AGLY_000729, partial [Aphis glycines]
LLTKLLWASFNWLHILTYSDSSTILTVVSRNRTSSVWHNKFASSISHRFCSRLTITSLHSSSCFCNIVIFVCASLCLAIIPFGLTTSSTDKPNFSFMAKLSCSNRSASWLEILEVQVHSLATPLAAPMVYIIFIKNQIATVCRTIMPTLPTLWVCHICNNQINDHIEDTSMSLNSVKSLNRSAIVNCRPEISSCTASSSRRRKSLSFSTFDNCAVTDGNPTFLKQTVRTHLFLLEN